MRELGLHADVKPLTRPFTTGEFATRMLNNASTRAPHEHVVSANIWGENRVFQRRSGLQGLNGQVSTPGLFWRP
eukprot:1968999-Pyramimonas_sp.AAC.2